MSRTSIIPFGKYKGQPVEVLAQDEAYMEWLASQDWFRQKYQNIYAVVINNFQAPSDTPEHNLMQGKFLDENYRFRVAWMLSYGSLRDRLNYDTFAVMECEGMDVRLEVSYEGPSSDRQKIIHMYLEIKPTVGDDYPAVLRQIITSSAYKNWKAKKFGQGDDKIDGMRFCLIVGSYSGVIDREQLVEYFDTASVKVLFESEINELALRYAEDQGIWLKDASATA